MATAMHMIENKLASNTAVIAALGVDAEQMRLALRINRALQTTLDPSRLIELFSEEMQSVVPHDGIVYEHADLNISLKIGDKARNSCHYNLNIGDEPLGEITFRRRSKFKDDEIAQLENFLCNLLYPLRNAILYQDAIQLSQKDPLTGVYNRAALDEALRREMRYANRQDNRLSLVVVDIDHFKSINDTYGHIIGDCVLKAVAQNIQGCMRSTDMLFRYGGEEFVVLMRDTDDKGACLLAERIRQSVANNHCECAGAQIPVTISAGVSTMLERDAPLDLFGRADQALYMAKELGRDQVRCTGEAGN